MENKERLGSSGIGGQAVIEGIMMRNKDKYAVAVRKPDKSIDVDIQECGGIAKKYKITTLPFIRGIFSFIDSMVIGIKTLQQVFLKMKMSRKRNRASLKSGYLISLEKKPKK